MDAGRHGLDGCMSGVALQIVIDLSSAVVWLVGLIVYTPNRSFFLPTNGKRSRSPNKPASQTTRTPESVGYLLLLIAERFGCFRNWGSEEPRSVNSCVSIWAENVNGLTPPRPDPELGPKSTSGAPPLSARKDRRGTATISLAVFWLEWYTACLD
jgi:hypothetical protein